MKVDVCNPFTRVYVTLASWVSLLGQKVHGIWKRIWGESPSFQYAFSQQSNADCHLQMWINYHRLQELRSKSPTKKLLLEGTDFKTHRLWLAETASHFWKWLTARSGPRMKEYMTNALQVAPCAPELFDSKRLRYSSSSWSFKEKGERSVFSPAFLQQMPDADLSYTLPFFEEKGSYFCYNKKTLKYELADLHNSQNGLSPANLILSEGQRASLPPHFDSLKLTKLPGKKRFIQARDPELAIGERFVPQHLGVYKLLLLNLGLDASNQPMETHQRDATAASELQAAMHSANTPWNPEYCKKEYLIEHAIANLFQQDHALAAKVQQHVDFFFQTWSRYSQDLPALRNGQGCSFSQESIDRYLPGKEQMLAYCLMKNIQFLWVASISSTAFCQHLGLPKIAQWVPFIPGPSQYKKAAYQKKEGSSLIEVWKEVAARVQNAFPQQKDWVSFSGHGMVLSFDPDLIQEQNKRLISDPKLAQDLGIAGIDSLYGKEMDVFYRSARC